MKLPLVLLVGVLRTSAVTGADTVVVDVGGGSAAGDGGSGRHLSGAHFYSAQTQRFARNSTQAAPPHAENDRTQADFTCVLGYSTGHVGTTSLNAKRNYANVDHVLFNWEGR